MNKPRLKEVEHTAEKPIKCKWCRKDIVVGEQYVVSHFVVGTKFCHYPLHLDCLANVKVIAFKQTLRQFAESLRKEDDDNRN